LHPRVIRNHPGNSKDFVSYLIGNKFTTVKRRGKFLWIPFEDKALVIHLGMSGQCLMVDQASPSGKHQRARFRFKDGAEDLIFVDQRTFGGMQIVDLVTDIHGELVPVAVTNIALDPLDKRFDLTVFSKALRARDTEIKRALLNQKLISGIGNIYADEALWMAKIHPQTHTQDITAAQARKLLLAVTDILTQAIKVGGTTFDGMYLKVNGESGKYAPSLEVYGQKGQKCSRCTNLIQKVRFMNRYSHLCLNCQKAQRR
jgi:formamidopyrimidine-DNA glycosylase